MRAQNNDNHSANRSQDISSERAVFQMIGERLNQHHFDGNEREKRKRGTKARALLKRSPTFLESSCVDGAKQEGPTTILHLGARKGSLMTYKARHMEL